MTGRQRRPTSSTGPDLKSIQRTQRDASEQIPKRRRQITQQPPATPGNSFAPLQALLGRALKGGGTL